MTERLAPISRDKIPTLVDHQRDGKVVMAFCPICDMVAEAADDGRGRESTTAASIAEIKLHIRKFHPTKSQRTKVSVVHPQNG